jgi:hypothetical protein
MLNKDNVIKRMKEVITNYQEIKKKMRGQPVDASRRALVQRVKHEALEELEALIVRL